MPLCVTILQKLQFGDCMLHLSTSFFLQQKVGRQLENARIADRQSGVLLLDIILSDLSKMSLITKK